MLNAFEQVAETQLTASSKARHRAVEKRMANLIAKSEADAPMVASPADKAMFESTVQFRNYRRWLKQREIDLLSGPYAAQLAELVLMLKAISAETAGSLVDWVEHADWLQASDYDTRHNTLALIGDAIAVHRVRSGLPPFDDSIMGEPPTAFEQIRYMLTGVGTWAVEACA